MLLDSGLLFDYTMKPGKQSFKMFLSHVWLLFSCWKLWFIQEKVPAESAYDLDIVGYVYWTFFTCNGLIIHKIQTVKFQDRSLSPMKALFVIHALSPKGLVFLGLNLETHSFDG